MTDLPIVVYDLDGTLTNTNHRQHYLESDPQDWDAFNATCVRDTPNEPICAIFRALNGAHHRLYIWTGRPIRHLKETRMWLDANGLYPFELWMKADDDHRHANDVKAEWLAEIRSSGQDVQLAFDDRAKCVAWWREQGVLALDVAGYPY